MQLGANCYIHVRAWQLLVPLWARPDVLSFSVFSIPARYARFTLIALKCALSDGRGLASGPLATPFAAFGFACMT
jgi:hypothetical protein